MKADICVQSGEEKNEITYANRVHLVLGSERMSLATTHTTATLSAETQSSTV